MGSVSAPMNTSIAATIGRRLFRMPRLRGETKESASKPPMIQYQIPVHSFFQPPIAAMGAGTLQRQRNQALHVLPSTVLVRKRFDYYPIQAQPSRIPLSFKLRKSSGSRNLEMVTSSDRPLRRRVLSTKSRAVACADAGSSGRSLMSLSSGSPGTMDHLSKTRETVAWPWVWICGCKR